MGLGGAWLSLVILLGLIPPISEEVLAGLEIILAFQYLRYADDTVLGAEN